MERNYMGLDSKDAVFNKEALELEGCKHTDGFECFNNSQEREIKIAQAHHANKPAVPVMMNNPFFRPVFSGAPVYSQLLTDASQPAVFPWFGSKVASVPAQLTIFYDGMVNVYDGISPEKAQAIMCLAGNGHFVATTDVPQQRTQAQGHTPTTPINMLPCSPVSSPMSVSSHYVGPLTGGSPNETEAAQRIMNSLGEAMKSAIPQARKASLARFLEKRKERVMASAPYSLSKNIMDCASNNNAAVVAGE